MQPSVKTPVHLWIIGTLAVLWNAIGAFDYLATQLQYEPYMGQFTQEQLDYFHGFPAWTVVGWALGVWGAFFGSVALLLRKSWAVWLFGASILGLVLTTMYNFVLTDGVEIMGTGGAIFSAVIWVVAIALFLYARAMVRRGVLR